jgi:RimJ/RimL family protein N-acetyltransferase
MRSEIRGGNILLRPYRKEDGELLFEGAREASQNADFRRWMPWCHQEYSRQDSDTFIEHCLEAGEKTQEFNFGIFDAASGTFLGGVGLSQFNAAHRFFNLGYWVRPSYQNRGIAAQAARLLAQSSFADLQPNRLEIVVAVENLASQRVAQKVGATREGILRKRLVIAGEVHDAVLFSLVAEDVEV